MGLDDFLYRAAQQDAEYAEEQRIKNEKEKIDSQKRMKNEKSLLNDENINKKITGLEYQLARLMCEKEHIFKSDENYVQKQEQITKKIAAVEELLTIFYEEKYESSKSFFEIVDKDKKNIDSLKKQIENLNTKLKRLKLQLLKLEKDTFYNHTEICEENGHVYGKWFPREGSDYDSWNHVEHIYTMYSRNCLICGHRQDYLELGWEIGYNTKKGVPSLKFTINNKKD